MQAHGKFSGDTKPRAIGRAAAPPAQILMPRPPWEDEDRLAFQSKDAVGPRFQDLHALAVHANCPNVLGQLNCIIMPRS
jgi:hypothetical protein